MVGGGGGLVGSVRNLGNEQRAGAEAGIRRQQPRASVALQIAGVTFAACDNNLSFTLSCLLHSLHFARLPFPAIEDTEAGR